MSKSYPPGVHPDPLMRASEVRDLAARLIVKWGDTCLFVKSLPWGSVALWANSDHERRHKVTGYDARM